MKRPLFRASDSAPTVTKLTRSRANTEASGPKVPPVRAADSNARPGTQGQTTGEAPTKVLVDQQRGRVLGAG